MTQSKPAAIKAAEPSVPTALLEWLEFHYPDKAQGIDKTQREADKHFGAVELVRSLRVLHDRQHQRILSKPTRVSTSQA